MTWLDYVVLFGYFALMGAIGVWAMRRVKKQEDYFMGGRGFGKLFQTFAAFGAGTGSSDPVTTARTTFTSGLSGMWSVMYWLFVTPIYWIAGVWYRRMRHLTLGDWFVERYESKGLGVAYAVFGLIFYIVYTAMFFTALGKFAVALMGPELAGLSTNVWVVLIIALLVVIYGVLGGITAAYWTDLIQGMCIVVLSVLLIPFGLSALVERFGDPSTQGVLDGFTVLHQQLPERMFDVTGQGAGSEFPLYRIVAIVIINLIGIVVLPHFIVTGGGSAKSEFSARVGLVSGNLLKRFCTIGWALTALILLALYADNAALIADPDLAWGEATKNLLPMGLRGLMFACLVAALMSSADCYMIVCSALVVRNVYQPYINPDAGERESLLIGRIAGVIVIAGAVAVSLKMNDVYDQLKLTWIVQVAFAAPFWLGLWWRRATPKAAWITVSFCALYFFVVPMLAGFVPSVRENPALLKTNDIIAGETITSAATPMEVRKRAGEIAAWEAAKLEREKEEVEKRESIERSVPVVEEQKTPTEPLGEKPQAIVEGQLLAEAGKSTGGKAIYWTGGVKDGKGAGNFKPDYLLYDMVGVDLTKRSDAMLDTFSLLPKIVLPFVVMIIASLLTRRNRKESLDRYYVKMKTPVDPDPERDRENLAASYAQPDRYESQKLFPGTDLEMLRPTALDIGGFLLTFAACFGIVGLVIWVASIGA